MTAAGERARRALIDAVRDDARPDATDDELERAVDRVLVRLWMAGFVVMGRSPNGDDRTGDPRNTSPAR
jgi:hypothetical protein